MPKLQPCAPILNLAARACAAVIGGFTCTNLLGELGAPGFDANLWLLDLRRWPPAVASVFLTLLGVACFAFALAPRAKPWRRRIGAGVAAVGAVVAAVDSLRYWQLVAAGSLHEATLVPYSAPLSLTLALLAWRMLVAAPSVGDSARSWGRRLLDAGLLGLSTGVAASAACILVLFAFGGTDYRRPADAVVVFGARAYADGTPSLALEDRTRTGCRLLLDGLAERIVFSGGPGDGELHETDVMRRIALELGVPDEAIVQDFGGWSTELTVDNTAQLFERDGVERVLAVSHGYHLPRIKLAYQRRGLDVFTVPAEETRRLRRLGAYVAREIAALGYYWLRPLVE